jgi:hypothetical protein
MPTSGAGHSSRAGRAGPATRPASSARASAAGRTDAGRTCCAPNELPGRPGPSWPLSLATEWSYADDKRERFAASTSSACGAPRPEQKP